jgi:hypothetical protein
MVLRFVIHRGGDNSVANGVTAVEALEQAVAVGGTGATR